MTEAAEFNDWCIIKGADWRKTFYIDDPTQPYIENPDYDPTRPTCPNKNPKTIPPPKDLSTFSAKMDIREENDFTSSALAQLSEGSGITLEPGAETGLVELFIDNTVTKAFTFIGEAFYDFWLIDDTPGADNEMILFGTIKVRNAATDV